MFGKKSETPFDITMRELKSRHLPLVADHRHAARVAALAAAKQAATDAAAADVAALQKRITEVKAACDAHHVELEDAADRSHKARSTAIATEAVQAFGPLVKAFMQNPCRQTTLAVREAFDRFDVQAKLGMGAELSDHLLGVAFADEIMTKPEFAGAINAYAGDGFGGGPPVVAGFNLFRRTHSPAQMQAALEQSEGDLLDVAHRAARAGYTPVPDRVALYALKKTCATRRDLSEAQRPPAELIAERDLAMANARLEEELGAPFNSAERAPTRFVRGVAVG